MDLLVYICFFLFPLVIGDKYTDEVNHCKNGDGECDVGPYCFGFNGDGAAEDNECNNVDKIKEPKCGSFASVTKVSDDSFKVVLFGVLNDKTNGWVGIAVSENKEMMNDKTLAAICTSDKNVEVYSLVNQPQGASSPKPPVKASSQDWISGTSATIDNGVLVCEFTIKSSLGTLDLVNNPYYVGIAHGNGAGISYHGGGSSRGSSANKMDFFKLLKVHSSPSGVESSVKATGGLILLISIILAAF